VPLIEKLEQCCVQLWDIWNTRGLHRQFGQKLQIILGAQHFCCSYQTCNGRLVINSCNSYMRYINLGRECVIIHQAQRSNSWDCFFSLDYNHKLQHWLLIWGDCDSYHNLHRIIFTILNIQVDCNRKLYLPSVRYHTYLFWWLHKDAMTRLNSALMSSFWGSYRKLRSYLVANHEVPPVKSELRLIHTFHKREGQDYQKRTSKKEGINQIPEWMSYMYQYLN
jgi:hypothetical protein